MAMDILPTFLGMAGVSVPTGVDGRDQGAMILRGGKSAHQTVHWVYPGSRAVRRGQWKLIENPPKYPGDPLGEVTDELWLSDLDRDPGERKNWAGAEPGVVREMRALLPERR